MYIRKTRDVYTIEGLYFGAWSAECNATTREEARQNLREYRENCPNTAFRIRRHREPIK